jgi:hypothetical protein
MTDDVIEILRHGFVTTEVRFPGWPQIRTRREGLDTYFNQLMCLRQECREFWINQTLLFQTYPHQRLLRAARQKPFEMQLINYRSQMQAARQEILNRWPEVLPANGAFTVTYSWPSSNPNESLTDKLYREEQLRIDQRFQQVHEQAEAEFRQKFLTILSELLLRVQGEGPRYSRQILRRWEVFLSWYRNLRYLLGTPLDQLIEQTAREVEFYDSDSVRYDIDVRTEFAAKLQSVFGVMMEMNKEGSYRGVHEPA